MLPGTKVGFVHGTVNRNKRRLSLDLGRREGCEDLPQADRQSRYRGRKFQDRDDGVRGVGYHAVRAVKPDIVYVSITGWVKFGPYSGRPGYDPIAQAASGFMSLNGSVERTPPAEDPLAIAHPLGGLHGVMGTMAALRHRDCTGEGQHVDIALLDTFTQNANLTLSAMGIAPQRNGNEFGFAVPSNVFACQDGAVYLWRDLLDAHWEVLARTIGHVDLADDSGFAAYAHGDARRIAMPVMRWSLPGQWNAAGRK